MDERRFDPALLLRTAELAIDFLSDLPERPVGRPIEPGLLRAALGGPLPERGEDPAAVVPGRGDVAGPGCQRTIRRDSWSPPRMSTAGRCPARLPAADILSDDRLRNARPARWRPRGLTEASAARDE